MKIKNFEFVKAHGFYVYVLGNIELLKSRMISVSGARAIDKKSSLWLSDRIKETNHIYTIVSGLALGADTIAHKTALENNIPTIAVLPSGFHRITPSSNKNLAKQIVKENGLLISEYPPEAYPSRDSYINRNRIIAKLGESLIVPQFEKKSGTMHTVNFAKNYNKYIFVQDAKYSGNKMIIKDDSYKTIIK